MEPREARYEIARLKYEASTSSHGHTFLLSPPNFRTENPAYRIQFANHLKRRARMWQCKDASIAAVYRHEAHVQQRPLALQEAAHKNQGIEFR